MREARVRPTLVTLNALASAHASVGDMDATERILGQATTSFRFSLDHYSFAALFQAARRVAINTHRRSLLGTSPEPPRRRAPTTKTAPAPGAAAGVSGSSAPGGTCSRCGRAASL